MSTTYLMLNNRYKFREVAVYKLTMEEYSLVNPQEVLCQLNSMSGTSVV